MSFIGKPTFFTGRLCLRVLGALMLVVSSSCDQPPVRTYSMEEQFTLFDSRSIEMIGQLEFSFKLEKESIPIGQDIFFIATFTNTLASPIVFRAPRQYGVMEELYPDTTLLFTVKPISEGISFRYPLDVHPSRLSRPVTRDEFVTLEPQSSREIRLQLPHMVSKSYSFTQPFPLPIGQYRVYMTYINNFIGYAMKVGEDPQFIDLNPWLGEIEAPPVLLTITPAE